MLRLARGTEAGARPARYYGWTMLLAVSIAQVTSWGILGYTFSVFLTPMREDLGWSIAELTGGYSLALLISGVAAVPVGRWLDSHGPRGLMTAGSIAATLLVVAWSRVESLWVYYLVWAGIGIVMSAVFYEPAFYIVAHWFERLRSRALTLLTFVGGFASVIYIPLAGWLVSRYDWRTALLVLAVILLVGTLPIHAFMLRRHPSDVGQVIDGGVVDAAEPGQAAVKRRGMPLSAAMHDASFWWLIGAFVLATFATMAITIHLIPYLTEQGYSTGFAAGAAGAVGLLALPGRLIFTPLGGRFPRQWVTALIFALQTLSFLVLVSFHTTAGVIVFVVLFGAGFGAITPARAALVADLYGPAHYGSINGVLALFVIGARAAAPIGAGLLVTALDSYQPVLWGLMAVSGIAAVAALQARRPGIDEV